MAQQNLVMQCLRRIRIITTGSIRSTGLPWQPHTCPLRAVSTQLHSDKEVKGTREQDPDSFGALGKDLLKKLERRKKLLEKKNEKKAASYAKTMRDKAVKERPLFDGVQTKDLTEDGSFSLGSITSKKQWQDNFGTLAAQEMRHLAAQSLANDEEEAEILEERPLPLSAHGRKNKPVWYGMQIEKLDREGKVWEAVQMLETKMLKEDRVMPTPYVFTALIGCLGRVGYTKKAFQLFEQMKEMGLQPQHPTYTGLFNACSNSPWKEDGLKRAKELRQLMRGTGVVANLITYKAMIKAFGVCGDRETAFSLLKEVSELGYAVDAEIYSFLLMACISDKDGGLRHAILVWRLMRKKKKVPTATLR